MERINTANQLDLFRRANAQLDGFFARFSGAAVLGTSEELERLLHLQRTLQSVEPLLREGLQNICDRDLQDEIAAYRAHLIRLRRELAVMQDSATRARARVFARQKHLHAAQAWCTAARETG